MDGCIANYQKSVEYIAKCSINQLIEENKWQDFKKELCSKTFFLELEEMPLVEILKKHVGKFEILTACGSYNSTSVIEMKKLWIYKVFGENIKFNVVCKSYEKEKYANKNSLLIDDRTKSTEPFIRSGGKCILFQNTQEHLQLIDKLLENI